jgi:hypothetical protein
MHPTTRCACSPPSIPWCGTAPASTLLWGWTYKFEAYTPEPQRKLGYYALPLLWGEQVIGWGNLRCVTAGWNPRSAKRSQGGVQFPTGGDGDSIAQARERPALPVPGSADPVGFRGRRSQSG